MPEMFTEKKVPVYLCSDAETVRLGKSEVELSQNEFSGPNVILRNVDFNAEDAKVAAIRALKADIDFYANLARPKPTNRQIIIDLIDAWNADSEGFNELADYLDHYGVKAQGESNG